MLPLKQLERIREESDDVEGEERISTDRTQDENISFLPLCSVSSGPSDLVLSGGITWYLGRWARGGD